MKSIHFSLELRPRSIGLSIKTHWDTSCFHFFFSLFLVSMTTINTIFLISFICCIRVVNFCPSFIQSFIRSFDWPFSSVPLLSFSFNSFDFCFNLSVCTVIISIFSLLQLFFLFFSVFFLIRNTANSFVDVQEKLTPLSLTLLLRNSWMETVQ